MHLYVTCAITDNTSFITVGFGLAFALNAAPLLITELSYPTQVYKIFSTSPFSRMLWR